MKKLIAVILVLVMALSLVACAGSKDTDETKGAEENTTVAADTTVAATDAVDTTSGDEPSDDDLEAQPTSMSYADYMAAELEAPVVVECYVQDHQSWWNDQITVYAADADGAYFLYNMACSEEDAAKLVPGTKICVSGIKGEWAGEIEILEATFQFVDDGETFIAEPLDATALLGTDELINHQNQLVSFTGLTVQAISFKEDDYDKDIYLTVGLNGASYDFCVENYLTGPDTDVYQTIAALQVGDVIDVTGFLYWYNGVNTHITGVTVG